MIDLTPLLTNAIMAVAAIIIAFVTVKLMPGIKKSWQEFRDAYPRDSAFLEKQIETGIIGAEKEFGSGEGASKLEAVLVYVEKQAERYGFRFDEYVVNMMIHAKLHELEETFQNSVK